MAKTSTNAIYRHEFTVPESAVDQNGHVNNVVYVQWMQDVAVLHSGATGGTAAMEALGATWVARSHWVEYLSPTFAGDEVIAVSWVVNFRRVRSLRRYRFFRRSDGALLAKGETDWVSVEAESGRPVRTPAEVIRLFTLLPEDMEPRAFEQTDG